MYSWHLSSLPSLPRLPFFSDSCFLVPFSFWAVIYDVAYFRLFVLYNDIAGTLTAIFRGIPFSQEHLGLAWKKNAVPPHCNYDVILSSVDFEAKGHYTIPLNASHEKGHPFHMGVAKPEFITLMRRQRLWRT
jgi:hypothetical protein